MADLPGDREPAPPELIAGRYHVVRRLGEGAFGVVFEAIDERIQRKVAVKVLRRGYAERHRYVGRFHQEAVAAAQLRHPNIVQVSDFSTLDDGRPFLVMEYLDGETLDRVLTRDGKLPPLLAARICRDLCLGLAVAHRAGIVHRDLKPANVIVAELDGPLPRVKILDFGIAKLTDEAPTAAEVTTSAVLGTPTYMAPEQVRQRDPIDGRVDIYAVGIILFKLLTGTTPFAGRTAGDVMVSKVTEEAPSPTTIDPTLDPELVKIVRTALRVDRAQRYQSAEAMADALGEAMTGLGKRSGLRMRAHVPWPVMAATGLAAVAVVAIAVPRWGGRGRSTPAHEADVIAPAPREASPTTPAVVPDRDSAGAAIDAGAVVDAGADQADRADRAAPVDAAVPGRKPAPPPPRGRKTAPDAGNDLLFGD